MELAVSSLAVAETSSHCTYPWRVGQAELACVVGLNTKVTKAVVAEHDGTVTSLKCHTASHVGSGLFKTFCYRPFESSRKLLTN